MACIAPLWTGDENKNDMFEHLLSHEENTRLEQARLEAAQLAASLAVTESPTEAATVAATESLTQPPETQAPTVPANARLVDKTQKSETKLSLTFCIAAEVILVIALIGIPHLRKQIRRH